MMLQRLGPRLLAQSSSGSSSWVASGCELAAVWPAAAGASAAGEAAAADASALLHSAAAPAAQPQQSWPTPACAVQQQQQRCYASGARGLAPSRKPAVKKPARHQWFYCAPDYDPMLPKPSEPLPPYAPPRAHLKDYRAVFEEQMPQHRRNRFRRGWAKQMHLADEAWKKAWQMGRAKQANFEASVQRRAEAIARRQAWAAWQAAKRQPAAVAYPPQQQQQQQQQAVDGKMGDVAVAASGKE